MLIDAHAHLAESSLSVDQVVEEVVAGLRAQGFVASIQGGVGPEDWKRQLALAALEPEFIKPVLGLHPWWVIEQGAGAGPGPACDRALGELEEILTNPGPGLPRVVAVGELGLDFYRDQKRDSSQNTHGLQYRVFENQLELAARLDLPVVLHVVHAHEVALEILRRHALRTGAPVCGIVHAFSGSYETAQAYLALGLKLSVGPGLAQPGRFKQLKSALPRLRPGDWVLESDGQGPELLQAARAAAGLTGRSLESVLERSSRNLGEVFDLNCPQPL
ncbi:MAG: TatD family hydrolase [Oligoflexia bacterium]